jgi:hypothetical protein
MNSPLDRQTKYTEKRAFVFILLFGLYTFVIWNKIPDLHMPIPGLAEGFNAAIATENSTLLGFIQKSAPGSEKKF